MKLPVQAQPAIRDTLGNPHLAFKPGITGQVLGNAPLPMPMPPGQLPQFPAPALPDNLFCAQCIGEHMSPPYNMSRRAATATCRARGTC